MKIIELTTAHKPLSEYAQEFGEQVIVLTLHQEPIAAIVSLREADRESLTLSMNPEFMEIIDRARAEFTAGKKLTLEEMKRQFSEE